MIHLILFYPSEYNFYLRSNEPHTMTFSKEE